MPSVLFVCTGNQFRSPIAAAAFLKQLAELRKDDHWIVESAGTWVKTGLPAHPRAIRMAQSFDLDIEHQRTCSITDLQLSTYDLIVVMERGHKEALLSEFPSTCKKIYLLSEAVDGMSYDIADPASPYIDPADVICLLYDLIKRGHSKIIHLAESSAACQI